MLKFKSECLFAFFYVRVGQISANLKKKVYTIKLFNIKKNLTGNTKTFIKCFSIAVLL